MRISKPRPEPLDPSSRPRPGVPPRAPRGPRSQSRPAPDRLARGWARPGTPAGISPGTADSYWATTRRPIPSLAFVGPLLLVYELGVFSIGGAEADAWRTGADAWMRQALATLGMTDRWFPPLCLAVALLAWQAVAACDWRFPPLLPLGMALESLVLAVALVGMSKLVDLGLDRLERGPPAIPLPIPAVGAAAATGQGAAGRPLALLLGFVGAGVYEEALFRLLMVPLFFAVLRLLQAPAVLASTLAVTASALLFSLAHHAGTPGEAFTWFAFVFRWLAGVYFAWVFVLRGFGVAVGTHTAYDILVGAVGWHL